MNQEELLEPTHPHRTRLYALLETIGVLLVGIGLGITISDRLMHSPVVDTVGKVFLILSLVCGGSILHQFAIRRRRSSAP